MTECSDKILVLILSTARHEVSLKEGNEYLTGEA